MSIPKPDREAKRQTHPNPPVGQPPETPDSAAAFDAVAPYYEHLMSAVPYRQWVSYLHRLWNRHGLSHQRVLDLACGTGTLSRMLATEGCRVVGVDNAPRMLEIARTKADEDGLSIDFICQDAAELSLSGRQFDAVVSLFDSLNYILEPARLAEGFRRVAGHLTLGGSFLFDLNTEYALQEGMFNQSCSRRGEALHYRWRSSYDEATRICTVKMNFAYDQGDGSRVTFKEVHRQRGYAKNEITAYLADAGFDPITLYDAYTFDPPTPKSDRIFYLAVKPVR
jgi:SAM-dependent methyltransferase